MLVINASGILNWLTAAAVVAVASVAINTYWERRKLNRSERSQAYAAFLHAFSRRWRAFGDRDGAKRADDSLAFDAAESRILDLRDDLYESYTKIQILAPQDVVEAALQCVRLSDQRNKAFKQPSKHKGVGIDARNAVLAEFVRAARDDLGLKALDVNRLRSQPAGEASAPWWAGGST